MLEASRGAQLFVVRLRDTTTRGTAAPAVEAVEDNMRQKQLRRHEKSGEMSAARNPSRFWVSAHENPIVYWAWNGVDVIGHKIDESTYCSAFTRGDMDRKVRDGTCVELATENEVRAAIGLSPLGGAEETDMSENLEGADELRHALRETRRQLNDITRSLGNRLTDIAVQTNDVGLVIKKATDNLPAIVRL